MRAALPTALSMLFVGCVGCGPACGDEVARIEALRSGDVLTLDAACVIRTSVTVPAGATVLGASFELPADAVVRLTPSPDPATPTTLADARVSGGAASSSILIEGAGHARVENLALTLERGVGIAAVDGAQLTVRGLELTGNVDPARVIELPSPAPPERFATYGLLALRGATLRFEPSADESHMERFASAAIGCSSSTLSVADAVLVENRGVGILAVDCTLSLERVEISGTLASPGLAGIGVAVERSEVDASELSLHDAPGYGFFARDSTCTIDASSVERMEQAGLWAEAGSSLSVTGSTLRGNAGASIAVAGARALSVSDTRIEDTGLAPIPTVGGLASEEMGDGIHVAEDPMVPLTVTLDRVMLAGNQRVGLVLDGADGPLSITITALVVDAPGTALGAVAQRVSGLPADWDVDVTRVTSATRDVGAAVITVSDGSPVGILMPPT